MTNRSWIESGRSKLTGRYRPKSCLSLPEGIAEALAFLAAFSLRASAIIFNIRMGPPGEFIRFGKTDDSNQQ